MLLALAGILAFALLTDGISYVIAGDWKWELGSFPAVSGTLRSITDAGWFYTTALLLGSGGIARMIMGPNTPVFLRKE